MTTGNKTNRGRHEQPVAYWPLPVTPPTKLPRTKKRTPKKNKLTINEFLLHTLGMTLTNRTWAWDGYDERTVVMKLWDARKITGPDGAIRIEVYAPPPYLKERKQGRHERREHVDRLIAGEETYAVLRGGRGADDGNPYDYNADCIYKLSGVVTDKKGFEFGVVERTVTVDEFLNRGSSLEQDLADVEARYSGSPTTRLALVEARIGQGKYRQDLLARWDNRCAVTRCDFPELLVASHAKPWKRSTDSERLDSMNGLPLVANLDALFDRGYIGFDAAGSMLVSPAMPPEHHAILGLPASLWKKPNKMQANFLAEHFEHVFKKIA